MFVLFFSSVASFGFVKNLAIARISMVNTFGMLCVGERTRTGASVLCKRFATLSSLNL